MSPPRSALPLPRYVLRKPLKNGTWAYFFNIPIGRAHQGALLEMSHSGRTMQQRYRAQRPSCFPR